MKIEGHFRPREDVQGKVPAEGGAVSSEPVDPRSGEEAGVSCVLSAGELVQAVQAAWSLRLSHLC